MQFRPEKCEWILAGLATETRRVKRRGEQLEWVGYDKALGRFFRRVEDGVPPKELGMTLVVVKYSYDNCRLLYQVGHDYAIQPGRTKGGIGRIRLLDIREERLQDITTEGARAEGCPNRNVFARLWDTLYMRAKLHLWKRNPVVWVYEFELVKEAK